VTTKETIQKKKNGSPPKKQGDPRVKELFDFWDKTFLQETGSPYSFSWGREGKLAKELLRNHSLDALKELTMKFFRDPQNKEKVQQGKIGYTSGFFTMTLIGSSV
jgi:hypothetical protein